MPAAESCFTREELDPHPSLRLVRRMNGSTQSLLIEDDDGHEWIVKMRSNLQGPNALANELLGSHLCRSLDLPTPETKLIEVPKSFLDDRRTWFEIASGGRERPVEGLHFASRFFPESSGKEVVEFLPPMLRPLLKNRDDCLGIFLFDTWAMHTDKRQAIFFEDRGSVSMSFIDHGHLFGGPHWSDTQTFVGGKMLEAFAVQEAGKEGRLAAWIARLQQVLSSVLGTALDQLPVGWFTGEIRVFERTFRKRLLHLPLLASEALQLTRIKVEATLAYEERQANALLRVRSGGGVEQWL